jgi:heptosyltransferase-3
VVPPHENLHEKEKSLLLIKKLLPALRTPKTELLSFPPAPAKVRKSVAAFFAQMGLGPGTKLVAIHPTLQKADNRWSQENYLKLVDRIGNGPGVKIVVVHGLGEEGELQRFRSSLGKRSNVFVLPEDGILFILEAAKRFDCFICNDSGLMHLAAGVTKVLALFGPSDPKRWGPLSLGRSKPMVFRSRDRQCDSVRPDEVARAVGKILN